MIAVIFAVEPQSGKAQAYLDMAARLRPELGRAFRYPGAFAQFSATPITYRRRPPTIGEHNREIYLGELGCTEPQFIALAARLAHPAALDALLAAR